MIFIQVFLLALKLCLAASSSQSTPLFNLLTQIDTKSLSKLKKNNDPLWNALVHNCQGPMDQKCLRYEEFYHSFHSCEKTDDECFIFHKAIKHGLSYSFIEALLSEFQQYSLADIKIDFPLIYRSIITNKQPDLDLVNYQDLADGNYGHPMLEKRINFNKHIANSMDKNQLVGLELECWPVKLKLDLEDNLDNSIIKACNRGAFDTYGLPVMCTEQKMGYGIAGKKFSVFDIVFESRYKDQSHPYIEIRSAPMSIHSEEFPWSVQNAKSIMGIIPQIVKDKEQVSLADWIAQINLNTKEQFGLSWIPMMHTWSRNDYWNANYLSAKEVETINKSGKEDLVSNSFYFDKKQDGNYCILQSNVDVTLGQFFNAPDFINTLGTNKAHLNYRALYVASWLITKEILFRELENTPILSQFDPRDYAAGIFTLSLYQAFIRSIHITDQKYMEKNSIPQLIKTPITDLVRLNDLKKTEKKLFKKMVDRFLNSHSGKLWNKAKTFIDMALGQLIKEDLSYYNDMQLHVYEIMSNWYQYNTFARRYPNDTVNFYGEILEFGKGVNRDHYDSDILNSLKRLPLEVGKEINPKILQTKNGSEISIVVETRSSYAPFNFFIFWDNLPKNINQK